MVTPMTLTQIDTAGLLWDSLNLSRSELGVRTLPGSVLFVDPERLESVSGKQCEIECEVQIVSRESGSASASTGKPESAAGLSS